MSRWETKSLADIAESVDYGVTASACSRQVGPKFLRITDIQDGKVDWDTVPWCNCDAKTATNAHLRAGDIVFARTGATTGKSFLIKECPENSVFASYLIRVRLARTEPRFVSHFFQTSDYWAQITKSARGVAQPGVNASTLKELSIPLPPLDEQRRIAEVLDRAEALRAKRRAALAQLDSLTQSLFLDLFSDPKGQSKRYPRGVLDDLCSFLSGFAWKADRFSKDPIGLPIIRIQNVNAVRDADFIYWPDAYEDRFVIQKGDLLLTLSGSFRIAEWVGPNALLNQRIVRIDSKAGVDRVWLLHAVRLLLAEIEALGRHALVNNVALSDLKKLPLVFPPLPLQQTFARRVVAVERLKASHRVALAHLDALFASLQHRAFRGEL